MNQNIRFNSTYIHCRFVVVFYILLGYNATLASDVNVSWSYEDWYTHLYQIYSGDLHWTNVIPTKWVSQLFETRGSAYVIAFICWLRHPVLCLFVLPILIVLFLYITVLCVHLCRLRWWLAYQVATHWPFAQPDQRLYDRYHSAHLAYLASFVEFVRHLVAAIWDVHGRIFNGYEVIGMNKLPLNAPNFIVYYHGTVPFDAYYFSSRYFIERDRFPTAVVDRFLFRLPGFRYVLQLIGAMEGTVDDCVERLLGSGSSNNPGVILLAPGGVREALFSNEYYRVMWGKRQGFAKIALLAKQPIYPMFTENIREVVRVVQFGQSIWRKVYEVTRLPFSLFYGYFPVKLRTYIGDPIYPMENETVEELVNRVKVTMDVLIQTHQKVPANLFCALLQRIPAFDKWYTKQNDCHHSRHSD